jgi:membrane protease YdiL (CAAX protease family)
MTETVTCLAAGLAVGLILLAVIRLVVEPHVPGAGARIAAAGQLPVWRRLIVIYTAAVAEELLFRLLLLSFLAGLMARISRSPGLVPGSKSAWLANVLSALAFAAVHLPAWSRVGTVSPGILLMVLALNGLGGLVFGYIFVKRGIGPAMWAHAGGDCAIQLIGPLTT